MTGDAQPEARKGFPQRFTWILAAATALLSLGALLWQGIDFFVGVALGCLIVGLNYVWTRSVVARGLRDGHFKARIAISYLAKFALTVVVLFLAILRFGVDPLAILVGISSLLLAVFVLAATHSMA